MQVFVKGKDGWQIVAEGKEGVIVQIDGT